MSKCIKCGSYAFNLYKEDIDQGGLCDVHYWQGRAHRAEAKQEQGEPVDDAKAAVAEIMEQAQVFASAWSLVGGRFDGGSAMDDAAEAKSELRVMVASLANAATTPQPKQERGEIKRLTAALKKANEQAEHFEREWYLRGDELEKLKQEQGEHVALPPVKFEKVTDGIDVGYDLLGGVDIRLGGEFVYVHINYDYRYTHNAGRKALADQIVELLTNSQPKQEQSVSVGEPDDLMIAYMSGLHDGKKLAKKEQGDPVANDILKWKLRGYTTLDPSQNERIAESFGWGKGESYDDCICCSAFNLHDFSEAIRFDERERLVGKTKEPAPDKSSLFTHKTLISYAASCVADALSNSALASEQEQPLPPVEIGVDVTSDGTSVVAFYRRPDAVMEMFYSQFHPLAKQEQGEPWKYKISVACRGCGHSEAYDMEINPPTPQQSKPLTEWQQIETAPTKGRELILLLTPSKWPQVAYANTWWTSGFSVENKPTHWMPIPPIEAAQTLRSKT